AVDECWKGGACAALESSRNSRCSMLLGLQNKCSTPLVRGGHTHGQIIGTQHDIRRQHSDEMFEVAVARRCQKRAHQLTLPRYIGRATHGASSATRDLASRSGRAIENRRDFLERQIKHIMQYEGEALSGSQLVENEQKRWADRISKHEVRV